MPLRRISLELVTLYAGLSQNVHARTKEHGSIVVRRRGDRAYLYSVYKNGDHRSEHYLGPSGNPDAEAAAAVVRSAANQARANRTAVSALKRARIPAPALPLGRVVEVISSAGLFDRGLVLIGTIAFQTYGPMLGVYLPSAAAMTNDADILAANFTKTSDKVDLGAVLQRADASFHADFARDDQLPKLFRSAPGVTVDVVTKYGRGRKSPVQIRGLGCAAEALTYMEYLADEATETAVLYGAGVLARVPPPARYAVHKLLVAQERRGKFIAKRGKDLIQARDLMAALRDGDAASLDDAMADARRRGPSWRKAMDASLAEIDRLT